MGRILELTIVVLVRKQEAERVTPMKSGQIKLSWVFIRQKPFKSNKEPDL